MKSGLRGAAAALILLVRFLQALLQSGLQTMGLILFRADRLDRGLIDYPLPPLREPGVLILAAMITLTPGTTTVGIDLAGRRLRLHLLDRGDVDGTVAAIRRDFEAPLVTLFGAQA